MNEIIQRAGRDSDSTNISKTRTPNLSRRKFMVSSAGAAGGLALGLNLPFGPRSVAAQSALSDAPEINAWVVIKPDDAVVIRFVRTEMGQGTLTGIAQLVAEELECDWKKVSTQVITAGQNLARKRIWGNMSTGGSQGIRQSQDYVRRGGAAARMMLLQAAADEWKVPVGELSVADSVIRHAASKRSISYGKVAASAARLTPPDPKSIQLKDPKTWKIAGKPLKRLDTADKLDGSKKFAIDLRLPNMLNAAVKQCPVFGGKLVSFDNAKITKMPGVVRAIKVDDATVAVVADTWWHAKTALEALPVVWDEGAGTNASSASIAENMRAGLSANDAFADTSIGDAVKAIASASRKIEADYTTPFLSHATMEPMNCTAKISATRGEVWAPTQNAEQALAALSETAGLPLAQCEVYRSDPGGGFGRRVTVPDYVRLSVLIAKQFPDMPVKMIYSREEDQMHGFYRPASMCRMSAGVDTSGNLVGMTMRVSGQSINAFSNPGNIKDGKDVRQLQGLFKEPGDAQFGYSVPNLSIEYAMRNSHVPVGPWRGVNTNQNGVYLECFMDEAAKLAGKDPLEFRRVLMKNHPKHLGVLNAVADKAGWGKPLPPGVHRGIAQFMGYASYSAAVAEVSVSAKGELKVHRMFLATNSGHVVNPGQVAAQIEGSVAFGLTATLFGEITIEKGAVKETNFHTYRLMRMAEFPRVESVLAPTFDFWGGVGEPTICVVAPAVMNAIFAATGKPVRSLPLKNLTLV
ncbi:MAG: molybdopterin cofactor-binding domain-containing protein [Burkholderiales bacterium]